MCMCMIMDGMGRVCWMCTGKRSSNCYKYKYMNNQSSDMGENNEGEKEKEEQTKRYSQIRHRSLVGWLG